MPSAFVREPLDFGSAARSIAVTSEYRNCTISFADAVRKISEHRERAKPEALAGATRGFLECVVDDAALAVDGEHRVPVRLLYLRHSNSQVLQAERTIQRRPAVADAGEQHRVHEARDPEIPLDPRERRKDRSNGGLLRLECELTEALAGKDTRQLKSQCPADVLLAAEERLDRDLRRLLHAGEQGIP